MDLRPEIAPPCVICGESAFDTVCTADDIAAQHRYLIQFHRHRLRQSAPESALLERAHFSQDYSTAIVRCRRCQALARRPRPATVSVQDAYQSDRYGSEKLAALCEAQMPTARAQATWLRPYLRRGARVVEVGSFVGCFLDAACGAGWEAEGIDPGDEVAAFCRDRGLVVHHGALEDAALPAKSIDAVVVWNTFDQIPDPHPLLRASTGILKPDGLFVVRVPNGPAFEWWLQLERRGSGSIRHLALRTLAWNNLLTFPYLNGYGVDTLDRLMGKYNLVRIRASGDTLCRLSDADTAGWATVEEQWIKAFAAVAGRFENLLPRNPLYVPPWINLCYKMLEK